MGVDEERQRIRIISREFSQAMKKISGMDIPEQNRALKIFKSAMERGDASFTLDQKGSRGTLRVLGKEIKINNPDVASIYDGLQGQADKKAQGS